VLRIILVRHGQTDWNDGGPAGEHFRGRIDIGLNPTGIAQAKCVADCLALVDVNAVYASPLQRAMHTAGPIAARHGLQVKPAQALLDINYGQWGGRSHHEVGARWPELYRQWIDAPHLTQIPGGESLDEISDRLDAGLRALLEHHDRQLVVLVGHQVVNKVLICKLLGLGNDAFWRIRQDTGCINRFDYSSKGATALTINEVCHLLIHPQALDELSPA
jgi:broad specificity phosphatase PhoE